MRENTSKYFDRDLSSQPEEVSIPIISYWKDAWMRFYANRLALISLLILIFLILCAIIIPFISRYTYHDTHLFCRNQPPSIRFPFGTDELGRDLFTRVWLGARVSLFIGITVAIIDMFIGVLYGAFAGLVGGKVEELMMRFADVLYSVPYLLVVILLIVIMNAGIMTVVFALTITGWINMARIVRGQILQIKEYDYVIAAHMFGGTKWHILIHHLIPNCIGSIVTTMTMTIPIAMFTEAFLSFLGLGIQVPIPSWGTMASDGLPALRYYPWRLFFPSIFISITIFALNVLGNGIRDAFDPRLRT